MNEYQSLLHSLSLNNKGKLIWTASYDYLQRFVEEYLNLREGSWSSPGGDGKLYEAGSLTDFSIVRNDRASGKPGEASAHSLSQIYPSPPSLTFVYPKSNACG